MRLTKLFLIVALAAGVACGKESGAERKVPIETAGAVSGQSAGGGDGMKAAFVRAANAACKQYAADDAKLDYSEDDLGTYVPFLEHLIQIGDVLDSKLRALRVPAADAKRVAQYLVGNSTQSKILTSALVTVKRAAAANDLDKADTALNDALDEFDRISTSQDPFARSYGLVECANQPDATSDAQA